MQQQRPGGSAQDTKQPEVPLLDAVPVVHSWSWAVWETTSCFAHLASWDGLRRTASRGILAAYREQ